LEILFLPLETEEEVEIYTSTEEGSEMVPFSAMKVVQIAAAQDMSDTVIGCFLKNHKVSNFEKLRKWKTLPPSVIL